MTEGSHPTVDETLAGRLNRPLVIGGRTIDKRLVFAPMTQVGNVAFREIIAGYGGYGLLFSEMCSARGLPHENRHISPYFRWRDAERDRLICQIVGTKPDVMAEAARRIEAEGLFGVDINFGCSVATICRTDGGAALLKSPDRALAIAAAVRKAVAIPVTVKYRTGWQDDPQPAVTLAKQFESAGVDALTFHPRVAPDRRSRPPRWEYIAAVKAAVSVPVFGNGDVFSPEDCLKMLRSTACDGVAVGRMAVARPWLFAEWTGDFTPDPGIYRRTAFALMRLLDRHYIPTRALGRFKKFAYYFSANFRFGHTLYSGIQNAPDMDAVRAAVKKFFDRPVERVSRPNRNFFT